MRASPHTKYRAVIVAFIILFISVAILAVWPDARQAPHTSGVSSIGAVVTYQCAEGKSILATYSDASVELELSDLRRIILPQVASLSGARYASENEQFVFWNKGDTAFVQENNALTFIDCVEEARVR